MGIVYIIGGLEMIYCISFIEKDKLMNLRYIHSTTLRVWTFGLGDLDLFGVLVL